MTQFESIRQKMKELVGSSASSNTSSSTSSNIFSIGGNSQQSNQQLLATGQKPNAEEARILEKIHQQNKLLEADTKSLKSISSSDGNGGSKSRRNSNGSSSPTSGEVLDIVEELKIQKWEDIITRWEEYKKKKDKQLKETIRQGIPYSYRKLVWPRLCRIDENQQQFMNGSATNGPHRSIYPELLKQSSPSEKLIRRDITRTYPEEEFFRGQIGQGVLFNVIKAYSLVDREVGYCQGSAFIAGLLLMHLPEEDSFQVFVSLMQTYSLREMFKPSMEHLGLCMFQFEYLLQEHCTDLYQHFQAQAFHTSSFASPWFLTLMATTFDTTLSSRILDVFISEGMEIIFRLGLAILLDNKDRLLNMDMEKMLMFIQKECPSYYNNNQDLLFDLAYKLVRYNWKKMKKLEKDYLANRSKENEDLLEMKSLRTENRLLLQRIEGLENENENLADKLINDRVNRALDAENRIRMEKELSIAKRQIKNNKNNNAPQQQQQNNNNTTTTTTTNCSRCSARQLSASSSDPTTNSDQDEYKKIIEDQLIRAKDTEVGYALKLSNIKERCCDLEERNRELTDESRVTQLEAELIAVKLREAEANNAMKELAHKSNQLHDTYKKHLEGLRKGRPSSGGKTSKVALQELQDELMNMRFRENHISSQNAELRQQVMELETANHISTSQLRRVEEDRAILKEKSQVADENKRIFKQKLNDLESQAANAESKFEEAANALRLYEAETTVKMVEMQQEITSLQHQVEERAPPGGGGDGDGANLLLTTNTPSSGETTKIINRLQERILKQQREITRMQQLMTSPNNMTSSLSDESLSSSDEELILKPNIDDVDSI